jgi:hypothetical protein
MMPAKFPPWNRLLLYSLGTAGLSLLHAAGYRGKYRPAVLPYFWKDTVLLFLIVFVGSFFIYYLLWQLAKYLDRFKKKEPIQSATDQRP